MLAPDANDALAQLQGILISTNAITQSVYVLENTVLPPISPVPDWYETISTTLQVSQQHSLDWLTNTAPQIINTMCLGFVNYADEFKTHAQIAQNVVAQVSTQADHRPTAAQTLELTQLIGSLKDLATNNQKDVQTQQASMACFHGQMLHNLTGLKLAISNAKQAEAAALALVQQVEIQIQDIELTLAADVSNANAAGSTTSDALTGLAVSLTFDPALSVGFAIALLYIGVDAVLSDQAVARVIADLNQLATLSSQLQADQIQLALLKGIVTNLENLASGIVDALTSFDDFDDTWSFAAYGLNYLLVVLDQPEADVSKIPDLNDLPLATCSWQTIATYANQVVKAGIVGPPQVMTLSAS